MSSPQPILEVSGLTVTRRGTRILRGIDWRILPGEMWTILGANGSGKTSLLNCLTGYLTPAAGVVSVLGETYGRSDWTELRKRVGMVSSGVRQMVEEEETPREIIGSGLYGQINFWGKFTAEDEAEIVSIAKKVKCAQMLERPWAVLSQGERQRVLTGRALATKPGLLILDEPCAGLDPVARSRFVTFMESLAAGGSKSRPGPAVVLVTHHLEEIPASCTHVLALREGKTEAMGPTAEVLNDAVLSRVFHAPVKVSGGPGLWELSVSDAARRSVF